MLNILNREHKQSFNAAMDEFPYCKLLLRRDDDTVTGYLLAVSDDITSDKEFGKFIETQCENGELCMIGFYKEEVDDHVDY